MARALPPEHSRFQKGRSGNPKGRPKKQPPPLPSSAFDIIIDRTLSVTQGGAAREVSVDEALEQRTYQAAIAGDRIAQREVYRMIARHEKARLARSPIRGNKIEVVHEHPDPQTADLALQILGIAARNQSRLDWPNPEKHLLLEPWAVAAALRTRSARRLSRSDVAEGRRCTRDAGSIAWPDGLEP